MDKRSDDVNEMLMPMLTTMSMFGFVGDLSHREAEQISQKLAAKGNKVLFCLIVRTAEI